MKKLLLSILLLSLLGCATTETDPLKVSTWDLLEGKRLKEHLETKRKILNNLQEQADSLSVRLREKQNELNALDKSYDDASIKTNESKQELDKINAEISTKTKELNEAQNNLAIQKNKIAKLNEQLKNSKDNPQLNNQVAEAQYEVKQLEKQVDVLERAVNRIILVRTKHGLETTK